MTTRTTATYPFDVGLVWALGAAYTLRTLGRAAHGTRRHVVVVDGDNFENRRRYDRALCGVRVASLTTPVGGVTCQRCRGGENPQPAAHDCLDSAVPYTDPHGALGHGFECGRCGALLQVG